MEKSSPFSLPLRLRNLLWATTVVALLISAATAQAASGAHSQLLKLVDQDAAHWQQISKQIWDFAELGYHETKSSALLQEQLKAAGSRCRRVWPTNRRRSSPAMARADRSSGSSASLTPCLVSRSSRSPREIR